MIIKRVLNILIFLGILFNTPVVFSAQQAGDIAAKQKQMQENIKRVRWLEHLEKGKLYKNQQRLEDAQTTLQQSETKISSARKELYGMQSQLEQATADYSSLNRVLAVNIRKVFKSQRKAFFELLISSEDINMLVDRVYFQKLINTGHFRYFFGLPFYFLLDHILIDHKKQNVNLHSNQKVWVHILIEMQKIQIQTL